MYKNRVARDWKWYIYKTTIPKDDFLLDFEKYIVDELQSEPDWENDEIITYTEDEAFKVVQQSCDWIDTTDTENALWCAWYSSWYEAALKEIKDEIESSNNKLR